MKLVTVQEMIAIEKAADAAGHSYQAMMEEAGKGLAETIQSRYDHLPRKTLFAFVGSGNNGGDALVALDYLQTWEWKTTAILCSGRPDSDPLVLRYQESGGTLIDWISDLPTSEVIKKTLLPAELIIDGLLGTGVKLPLREPILTILSLLKDYLDNTPNRPVVVAVDCPSGLDCDTGDADSACIPADLTVTMAAIKRGFLEFPAYNLLGELSVVDIGLPDNLPELTKVTREIITNEWANSHLPERPLDAHKGVFGSALIIAGSDNYPGAAILAGESSYRAGAGLVRIAVPESIYEGVIGVLPEATWIKLSDQGGGISSSALTQIKNNLERITSCLVGPGLGIRSETAEFLEGLLEFNSLPPLVIDADGLRLTKQSKKWPELIPGGSILTPHPGELAEITEKSIPEIQEDRVGITEKYSKEWNQILVLKGAHTIVAEPGGRTMVYLGAEPALAKAGSGDVLAGIIAGLLAQGLKSFEAAAVGVWLHGEAGKLAKEKQGDSIGVIAGDISSAIGDIIP